jgi:N-acyl-phosphatidylethanolamine-hydrolysing phospholipase D
VRIDDCRSNFRPMRNCVVALACACLLAACAATHHEPAVRALPRDDPSASLSVVWVGHATVLIRIGHRFVLTDPNLSGAMVVVPRVTPPSLRVDQLPPLQLVLLSHMHIDHFDRPTLDKLPRNTEIVFPPGAGSYLHLVRQERKEAVDFWKPIHRGGLTITAVPVRHAGGRFAVDALWNHSAAGYVIEGGGRRVFFAGDTGYDEKLFAEIGARYPGIDLALLPIAPARGGNPNHASPDEAVRIFRLLGARYMIPIHFEAYHSTAVPIDEPRNKLAEAVEHNGLQGRVFALYTGERWVDSDDGSAPWVTRETVRSGHVSQ